MAQKKRSVLIRESYEAYHQIQAVGEAIEERIKHWRKLTHSMPSSAPRDDLQRALQAVEELRNAMYFKLSEARQYAQPESAWEVRLITIAAYILPKDAREEWLGDLQESLYELRCNECPRWIRTLIAFGRVCLLGFALIRIRLKDLVSPAKKKRQL